MKTKLVFRKLNSIFYFSPTFCGWEEDGDVTFSIAWLCWSAEYTFFDIVDTE